MSRYPFTASEKNPVMECGLWVKCQIAQMKATKH